MAASDFAGSTPAAAPVAAPVPADGSAQISILEAIRGALFEEMGRDDRVMVLGMDVGRLGGVFRVTRGLLEKYGPERVVDTPLAEGAIVGASLGLAIGGMVPVAEIQFLGFTHQAFHQIGPQLGRYRFRSRGRYHAQVTIRAPFGGGVRTPEFHPDAIEAQFSQTPGVKVVCPAFPDDAKGLLLEAIRDPDPVLYLEPQRLYRSIRGPVPAGDHTVPFGSARLVREGTDLLLVAWSAAVHKCLEAADQLAQEGVSVSVLDLRTLIPLDVAGWIAAVQRSGKVVVVHESPVTGGFGAEIVATIQQEAFGSLDAPIRRVAARDTPYPPGALEDHFLPSVRRILAAARATVEY
jgi:pyruvate dehydrogenase E1 component beta subunit